jgi:hypothetical protein
MILFFMSVSNAFQTFIWIKTQQVETRLLKNVPIEQILLMPKDALLLVDFKPVPEIYDNFGAFWDISGAISITYPAIAEHFNSKFFATVAKSNEWKSAWDGQNLSQKWCRTPPGEINWVIAAKALFIWNSDTGEFTRKLVPFEIGCKI